MLARVLRLAFADHPFHEVKYEAKCDSGGSHYGPL